MGLAATIALSIAALKISNLDQEELKTNISKTFSQSFADGTGDNQAQVVFSDTRTLAASATENLDLSGTALQDAFNQNIALTKIKGIIIAADSGNTNDVLVGGAASNALSTFFGDATDLVKVKPGGVFCLLAPKAAGYGVTAATADILKIANSSSGTGVTYTIIVFGA